MNKQDYTLGQTFEEVSKSILNQARSVDKDELVVSFRNLELFLKERDLVEQWIHDVNERYADPEYDLQDDAWCVGKRELVSCFVTYNLAKEVNWSAINEEWQELLDNE